MRIALTVDAGDRRDVVVEANPAESTGAVLRRVTGQDGPFFVEDRAVDEDLGLGDSQLLDGVMVGVGRRARTPSLPRPGTTVVAVVGGPSAGAVLPLRTGATVIGRSAPLALNDPDASRRHLSLAVGADGAVTVADLGSSNGTTVDGAPVTTPLVLRPGALVQAGHSLLAVRTVPRADAHPERDGAGGLAYNRPPRVDPPRRPARITMPTPPPKPSRRDLPIAMVVVPLIAGVATAILLKRPEFLLFVLLSPALLITSTISDRRNGTRSHRQATREYEQARDAADAALADALAAETARRRVAHPDPAELLVAAGLPTRRLWERRNRLDADFLEVRVGLATLPSDTEVVGGRGTGDAAQQRLHHVPATVALPSVGVLGIAGPAASARGLARCVLTQLTVLHSPSDLAVTLLADDSRRGVSPGADWSWVRWLPHLRPADGISYAARIGSSHGTVQERVGELVALVDRRSEDIRRYGAAAVLDRGQAVVVVLDGARALRSVPGMSRLLTEGPALGMTFICLDEQETALPRECGAVAVFDEEDEALLTLRSAGADEIATVVADQVDAAWAERVARCLAPLRDADPTLHDGALPGAVRLLDLHGLGEPHSPSPAQVADGWRRGGRSTRALIGVGADGPFSLDLAAGPHMLVAGTTGAGKSGLLQTLVAALALANRPDAMTFVLVDYKGRAAFRDCENLPHTVGMVTDLDAALTERALSSLKAELRRRERLLDQAAQPDILAYWRSLERPGGAGRDPMPRLMICIDEFAQLVAELPDFVNGLVDVAARGRSLGIHLVLATQHPAGVVSAQIKANTNLKIALRVTDDANSIDVIGSPEAGRLPPIPGRAYVKIGAESPVAFQTARIDGPRPGVLPAESEVHVTDLAWERLGLPLPVRREPPPAADEQTDLALLVDVICKAAADIGVERPASPWLPSLPDALLLADVPAPRTPLAVPFGLEDVPAEQRQSAAVLDLEEGGHLAVAGTARTGRTTLLRTLGASLATTLSPMDVQLYVLDFGGGGLRSMGRLPHCGGLVTGTEPDRAERLIARLSVEMRRRRGVLADHGVADLAELRREVPAQGEPYVVLLLDGWEAFVAAFEQVDGGRVLTDLFALLREGQSSGLRVVVAGDRAVLTGQLGSLVSDRLVLRLASDTDYAFAGISYADVPSQPPAGRAMRASVGTQVQVALLGADAAGRAQAAAVGDIADITLRRGMITLMPERVPLRVDPLPERIALDRALALPRPAAAGFVFVGVGGDELSQVGFDPATDGPALLVLGPRGSGRSTALAVLAGAAAADGMRVVLLAPRPAPPLRAVAGGSIVVVDGPDFASVDVSALVKAGQVAILLDDAEAVADQKVANELVDALKAGLPPGVVVGVAGNADMLGNVVRGPAAEAGRGGVGLVLSPSSPQPGMVFGAGIRLPRSMVGESLPGRGVLLRRGTITPVQVPLIG